MNDHTNLPIFPRTNHLHSPSPNYLSLPFFHTLLSHFFYIPQFPPSLTRILNLDPSHFSHHCTVRKNSPTSRCPQIVAQVICDDRASELVHPRDAMMKKQRRIWMVVIAAILNLYQMTSIWVKAKPEEAEPLENFMRRVDQFHVLEKSWKGDDPCSPSSSWFGVECEKGSVYNLKLENMQLQGEIPMDSLSSLSNLRRISLKNNNLTGPLPDLSKSARSLLCIWLQDNHFSGPIPAQLFSMTPRLKKLELARNQLSGPIPLSLASVPTLDDLHLESNVLNGTIPPFNQPSLKEFNVSFNRLDGPIPQTPVLLKFSESSFQTNLGLCGRPTSSECPVKSPLPEPEPAEPPAEVEPPPPSKPPQNVETPRHGDFPSEAELRNQHVSKASRNTIIAVVVPGFVVVILVTLLCIRRAGCSSNQSVEDEQPRKFTAYEDDLEERSQRAVGQDERQSSRSYDSVDTGIQQNLEKTRLVFFKEDGTNFALEELLQASAEMLGKGSFGATYKAIVGTGPPLAVKRFRGDSNCGKREFHEQMQALGRLNHPNLLPLRAYSYAKDQHLLVSDFMPNGNLFTRLHGDRGSDRTPLTWPERLKVSLSIARALSYLHQECNSQNIPHGNVKSTNVLLDQNMEPLLCDFGLVTIIHPSVAAQRMAAFKDPEYLRTKKINNQADVFSFGVLILELLTGRVPSHAVVKGDSGVDLPKWVSSVVREEWTAEVFDVELGTAATRSNEEMVNLLQIGMFCVAPSPQDRPKLISVVQMIEEIQEIQSAIDLSLPSDTPYLTPATSNTDHSSPIHEDATA